MEESVVTIPQTNILKVEISLRCRRKRGSGSGGEVPPFFHPRSPSNSPVYVEIRISGLVSAGHHHLPFTRGATHLSEENNSKRTCTSKQ